MKKSIISLFIGLLGFGSLTTSCEDMLTPDLERYATEFTGNDTVHFYIGILNNLQQVTEQNLLLGELRGDLVVPTEYVTDSIKEILTFQNPEDGDNALLNRAAYYKVINQCNYYLDKVDSLSMRNNYYYMRKETAQVLLIRAWTYMQLVQNYGRVPFITKPIGTSTTGWETNPDAWATPDNLLDLVKADMDQAWTYCEELGYPNYSSVASFNTGLMTIDHRLMNFDADVVFGDLYLLRGQGDDFAKAAEHYYNFLYKNERARVSINTNAVINEDKRTNPPTYDVTLTSWAGDASGSRTKYTYGGNEIVTGVPSAANSHFGSVLARIPDIYGFEVHSGNSTSTTIVTKEDGTKEESYSTTGRITLTPSYKLRQVKPSSSYLGLNYDQIVMYRDFEGSSDPNIPADVKYVNGAADARMNQSAPWFEILLSGAEDQPRFITKFGGPGNVTTLGRASAVSFRYLIPLYRFRTIMLRYAEALNRAGFPGHAFAVLRDGLSFQTYPGTAPVDTVINDADSIITYHVGLDPMHVDGPNFISNYEIERAANTPWIQGLVENSTFVHSGVHAAGCGTVTYLDSLYTYQNVVDQRIADELLRTQGPAAAKRYVKMKEGEEVGEGEEGEGEGEEEEPIDRSDYEWVKVDNTPDADLDEQINAVELLIADEYALETAFEGNRYYDLMRIARHLNKAKGGNYGTEWMAWKIARRGIQSTDVDRKEKYLLPYENPTLKDEVLYNYLLDEKNWYMQNPKY